MEEAAAPRRGPIEMRWLGRVPYRDAWDLQRAVAAARASGESEDQLLLLEHDAVLTLGRQADPSHVRASPDELRRRGIEVLRVERGGEVTYHGPGQLVAYPVLRLDDRGLLLRPYVRALEAAMIDTCAAFGVIAARRDGHPGCWVGVDSPVPRKIGALGIRVERGVTYHGISLNVDVDLRDFELIDPCGMPGLVSTSIAVETGRPQEVPDTAAVHATARVFASALADRLGAALHEPGDAPPAQPAAATTAA